MIALANKDFKKAIKESKKISNHLDDNPTLSLLLRSEVFKIEKKYLQNEDIKKSLNQILLIDEKADFFLKWINQAKIYLEFTKEIAKVI